MSVPRRRLAQYLVPSLVASALAVVGRGGDDGGSASNAGTGGSGVGGNGGSTVKDGGGSDGAFFDASNQSDGSGGGQPDADPDATCGATGITIEAIPPDMLVVFDRSCSMRRFYDSNEPIFGYGPDDPHTRWAMANSALDQIMSAYENRVRFGLMVFPRPYKDCGDAPQVNVMPQVSNRSAVLNALEQVHPFDICASGQQPTVTPTADALASVQSSGVFEPSVRDAYVLLMTDGMATCGASAAGLGQMVSSIASSGAKTAVVGFGDVDQPEAAEMLNAMGQAGGVKTSQPWYWFAENPGTLLTAIGDVVQSAVSCKFKLNDTPPDPDKVYAYFDGQQVPAEATNGWTYDPATDTVSFHGASCQTLQSGSVKNVSIVFGCPDSTCVPSTEVCDGYDNDCDGIVDEGCVN